MVLSTITQHEEEFAVYKSSDLFQPESVGAGNLVFDFKTTGNENQLCVYNLQVMSHKQVNHLTTHKALPPAYLQNPCGVFQLSELYPTKLDLNSSWDKSTVKDNKCFFYMVNEKAELKSLGDILVTK